MGHVAFFEFIKVFFPPHTPSQKIAFSHVKKQGSPTSGTAKNLVSSRSTEGHVSDVGNPLSSELLTA